MCKDDAEEKSESSNLKPSDSYIYHNHPLLLSHVKSTSAPSKHLYRRNFDKLNENETSEVHAVYRFTKKLSLKK